MKVCVQGLWHLGTVTAACLASLGHQVVGLDFDEKVVNDLNHGKPPIFEPKLENLVKEGLQSKNLTFTNNPENIKDVKILWVAYDTPVDEDDNADINFVIEQIQKVISHLDNCIVLVSSQMPIGSIKKLEKECPNKNIHFASSPENLRLGNALNIFLNPDRIVVGTRSEEDKLKIKELLETITSRIEWMSVESAEMTKHAINSFLATSVVFANEIASLCEVTGADAKEVERGLKSEQRIGPKAYLSPGAAFSGGTLARDVEFLKKVAEETGLYKTSIPLLNSIKESNDHHKFWGNRTIIALFKAVKSLPITVWGITYKAGTDTLRRSLPLEMTNLLVKFGANVRIYDPIAKVLPDNLQQLRYNDPIKSLLGSSVLLINNEYPEYRNLISNYHPENPLIILDPNRYLSGFVKNNNIKHISVGSSLIEGIV